MNKDLEKLKLENDELNEKLEAKRNTIKSLCEELDGLRIVSIENQRLTIENKHLKEGRPQSELDAAHLAAENAMLNTNFARYISATQDTEKENERLASMVRELQDDNAALKDCLDWAETILCNSLPMQHSTLDEWNEIINKWRDSKHAIDAARAEEGQP